MENIIIGYYQHLNDTMSDINVLCNIIAYSIFKENNKCKWNELLYKKTNVQSKIVKGLQYLHKMQIYMKKNILKTKSIASVINYMTTY